MRHDETSPKPDANTSKPHFVFQSHQESLQKLSKYSNVTCSWLDEQLHCVMKSFQSQIKSIKTRIWTNITENTSYYFDETRH
jgi:hypothetical protein